MKDPVELNRRHVVAGGIGSLAALSFGGVTYWQSNSGSSVQSDDDDISVHQSLDDSGTASSGDDTGGSVPGNTDDVKSYEIELDIDTKVGNRFNSDSVSFVHNAFQVCNHGKESVDIWIESDAIHNNRGESSAWFYLGTDLDHRIDSVDRTFSLEPDSCASIGLIVRTFGIPHDTTLLETVHVRTA